MTNGFIKTGNFRVVREQVPGDLLAFIQLSKSCWRIVGSMWQKGSIPEKKWLTTGALIDKFIDRLHRLTTNNQACIAITMGHRLAILLGARTGYLAQSFGWSAKRHPLGKTSRSIITFPMFSCLQAGITMLGKNAGQACHVLNQVIRPGTRGPVLVRRHLSHFPQSRWRMIKVDPMLMRVQAGKQCGQ